MITEFDIRMALDTLDVAQRPLAIFCNPNHEKEFKEAVGDTFLVISSPAVPEDKCYVYKRKTIRETINDIVKEGVWEEDETDQH